MKLAADACVDCLGLGKDGVAQDLPPRVVHLFLDAGIREGRDAAAEIALKLIQLGPLQVGAADQRLQLIGDEARHVRLRGDSALEALFELLLNARHKGRAIHVTSQRLHGVQTRNEILRLRARLRESGLSHLDGRAVELDGDALALGVLYHVA